MLQKFAEDEARFGPLLVASNVKISAPSWLSNIGHACKLRDS